MELKGKKINFLGDSIVAGVGASGGEDTYARETNFVNLIAKKTGAQCRNYGKGATSIVKLTWSERVDFNYRADFMERDADIVVIFGGTNDFGHCERIGTPQDRTIDTFYGAVYSLFYKVVEMFPNSAVVVMTPFHRHGENLFRVPGAPLSEYRRVLLEMAEEFSLPVLDVWAESGIQPQLEQHREMYMPDGLHPNDRGHARLADMVVKFLEEL